MAWNPNEEGSWAWLTKTAREHGGVEEFMDDLKSEGNIKFFYGVICGFTIGIIATTLFYKCFNVIKAKKQKNNIHEDDDSFYTYSDDES